jgi:hypothetical protein
MEKIPGMTFKDTPITVTKQVITVPSRKLTARWTTEPGDWDVYKPYELTEEEKASLSPEEQETWKVLKTTEKVDLESEMMSIMSKEISKEIDAEMLSGTFTK